MQDTLKRLLHHDVDEVGQQGRAQGHQHGHLLARRDNSERLWNSKKAAPELRLMERLLQLVGERLDGASARLHPYRVLNEKALCITGSDRTIGICGVQK